MSGAPGRPLWADPGLDPASEPAPSTPAGVWRSARPRAPPTRGGRGTGENVPPNVPPKTGSDVFGVLRERRLRAPRKLRAASSVARPTAALPPSCPHTNPLHITRSPGGSSHSTSPSLSPIHQRTLDHLHSSGRSTSPRSTGLRWMYRTVLVNSVSSRTLRSNPPPFCQNRTPPVGVAIRVRIGDRSSRQRGSTRLTRTFSSTPATDRAARHRPDSRACARAPA